MEYDKEHVNDLYEDMDRLNSLYEELMWEHEDVLEMVPDYANDRIIIKNKSREMDKDDKSWKQNCCCWRKDKRTSVINWTLEETKWD